MDPLPPPSKKRRPSPTPPTLPVIPEPPPLPPIDYEIVTMVPDEDGMEYEEFDISAMERDQLRDCLSEIARREREALRLFEPLESQAAFLESRAGERLARGGNRGGKTLLGAIECARAVTGQDPYKKYPKESGRFVAVGKDLVHCGKVMWRKLSKPGAFKIIRDPDTRKWRAFRPGQEWDEAHRDEVKDAPPLIPRRYIKAIAWENKKDEIPKTVMLTTGWELSFFSSIGAPPQGWDVDAAWFDEEIEHAAWYPETSARLLDRGGRFYWTATPQAGTQFLYDLHLKSEKQKLDGVENPTCQEFYLTLLANPHIDEAQKREFADKLSEDEYRIRVLGDFALLGMRVYPEFAPRGPHGADPAPIPADWTRWIAVDPGRQFCAVLFAAIPPPSHPDHNRIYIYDELYIRKANAKIFAEMLRMKIGEQEIYGAIIDARAGRITEIGSGLTHEEQYSRALAEARVSFTKTGTRFTWSTDSGGDDVKAGIEAVRLGLHIDPDGRSKYLFVREKLKHLCDEMGKYCYRKLPSGVVTDEPIKSNDHLCDCLRYIAMARLKYTKPKVRPRKAGYTTGLLKAKAERAKARGDHSDNSVRLY